MRISALLLILLFTSTLPTIRAGAPATAPLGRGIVGHEKTELPGKLKIPVDEALEMGFAPDASTSWERSQTPSIPGVESKTVPFGPAAKKLKVQEPRILETEVAPAAPISTERYEPVERKTIQFGAAAKTHKVPVDEKNAPPGKFALKAGVRVTDTGVIKEGTVPDLTAYYSGLAKKSESVLSGRGSKKAKVVPAAETHKVVVDRILAKEFASAAPISTERSQTALIPEMKRKRKDVPSGPAAKKFKVQEDRILERDFAPAASIPGVESKAVASGRKGVVSFKGWSPSYLAAETLEVEKTPEVAAVGELATKLDFFIVSVEDIA